MSRFFETLGNSLLALRQAPKLFIPKIIIALLYTLPLLGVSGLAIETILLTQPKIELLLWAFFWLFYLFAVSILELLVNAMYPFMVEDFYAKRDISFARAFSSSLKKFFVVVPAVLIAELLAIILIVLLAILFLLALFFGYVLLAAFFVIVFLAVVFVLFAMFFLLYPVAALEKQNFLSSIVRSVSLARKNAGEVSKAAAVVFAISLFSFALAFVVNLPRQEAFGLHQLFLLVVFFIARLLVALFATYQYVLNPVFYMEYVAGASL